jgi:hypothetical protein
MNNVKVSVTMGLAALLLAGVTKAQDITIKWKVSGDPLTDFYLPKVASDAFEDVAIVAEAHTGLNDLQDKLGFFQPLAKAQVGWTGTNYLYGPTQQIGHAPSIALAYNSVNEYDAAIEVHQGGQEDESSLWFQLGSNATLTSPVINWGDATQLGPGPWTCGPYPRGCGAPKFDYGYNATVAADNDLGPAGSGDAIPATIVEVHQAAAGESALYYHVGVLTIGPSPSITWGPSLPFDSSGKTLGSVPTVSIANNVAVLVSQGSGGTLWYSIGAVDTATSTIAWTAPISYGSGYNPTVSVYGDGTDLWIRGRVLVEAHQVDDGTGSLVYSVGVLKGSSPTSITWSTTTSGSLNTNIYYATGCYPSVALAFDGYTAPSPSEVSVTETHETACGSATMTEYWFGYLIGK